MPSIPSPDGDLSLSLSPLSSMVSGVVACGRCAVPMERDELRFPNPPMVSRVGSPARPPRVLPIWKCRHCGLQQPRIEP
jgi:hypothetical protein